jgi:ribonucleoside-diphosphate reductase alpha chain
MVLNENSELIFKNRYALNEEETWEGLSKRVAMGGAQVESDQNKWMEEFSSDIFNMLFLPGGRILRNVGRPRGTLFNCYVEPLEDSMRQIGQFQMNSGILWSEGGGVGCNASFLRPENAPIIQKGGESSGPISFLKWANAGANCIKIGGSRRAAALAMMNVSHPDIIKFINAKLVEGELNCFNISVAVTEDFLQAVESNDDWNLKWRNKVWETVKARDIWNLILKNMVKCAEPGLINWDNLRSNNSYYFDPIISTNPCGEVPLGAHGVCCLGSLVLPNFITGTRNTNWQLMEKTVHNSVRFLDNIIQINKYVIEDIKQKAFDGRRIGLGVMGLAEYLFAKRVRYGSQESIRVITRLMENIRNYAYEASCKLSEEKEPFPKFDVKEYSKAHFFKTLPASLRMGIKKHGMRNVSVMAVAPTGTISLLPEVSSSIEPLFCKSYLRSDQISKRAYIHPTYKTILENNEETPDWYVDSFDLKPEDHFETQVAVQKYLDGAVSKTINCPRGFKEEQLSDLLLEYIRDLKGVTLYVDGSREGQVLNPLSREETLKYLEEGKTVDNQEEQECSSGSCDI